MHVSSCSLTRAMSMILASKVDAMPHMTRTKSVEVVKGEKIMEKILSAGRKWKNTLEEVSKVRLCMYNHLI